VYNLIYDRRGELIITGDDMGLIKVWSASTGLLLNSLKGHTMAINALEVNHSNEYLSSCSNDGFVIVWELKSGRPITALRESNEDPILVLLFHKAHEEFLIVASEKGNVYVYRMKNVLLNVGRITPSTGVMRVCVKSRPHFIKERMTHPQNGILSIDMHP
jgi:bromodomain and WD repeat domain-containing protein 1/3